MGGYQQRRRRLLWLGLLALLISPASGVGQAVPAQVAVYFSPNGGATDAVVREIAAAKTQILVQAYSFTSVPIAKALVEAQQRGIRLLVVLDKSNQLGWSSVLTVLNSAGIQTRIDDRHAMAHSTVLVIDSTTVLTGSFTFTKAAEEKNVENLLVITNAPELVQQYEAHIRVHAAHAQPYTRYPSAPDVMGDP